MLNCAGMVGCVSPHLIQLLPSNVVTEVESNPPGNHPRFQEVHLLQNHSSEPTYYLVLSYSLCYYFLVSTSVGPISKFCDTNLVPISDFLWNFSRVGSQVSQESYFYRYGMSMSINLVKIKPKGINIEYHGSDTSGVCTMVWYYFNFFYLFSF